VTVPTKVLVLGATFIGAAILLAIALRVFEFFTTPSDERPELRGRLNALVKETRVGDVVDLVDVAPFDWSEVVMFPPHHTNEMVERELGFSWNGNGVRSALTDGWNLVVFSDGQSVVAYFTASRGEIELPSGITGRPLKLHRDLAKLKLVGGDPPRLAAPARQEDCQMAPSPDSASAKRPIP